ncbi:MAG: acyl-CoA thioesterase [Gammaproteobacteria bacterium]|nr:acyl-CoA thioesterase [Gammaproteobacteria bacterium]
MSTQTFIKKIVIPFQDVDAAGVVFFSHLFRYAHETYEDFMKTIGHPLNNYLGNNYFILPLKHAEADYEIPIMYGDELEMTLIVKEQGNSSFTIFYKCINRSGKLCAVIKTVHVAVSTESNKPVSIPDDLRKVLSDYS